MYSKTSDLAYSLVLLILIFDFCTLQLIEERYPRRVGKRSLEPKPAEVDFFPIEEVLHERVRIQRLPDHRLGHTS
jgi:hypothetical protein